MPRGKLACTDHSSGAIRVVFTYSEKKGAIVACADLRSDTHLGERPRTKIKPCHCAGTQTNTAIVRDIKVTLPLCKYIETSPRCWNQNNCLPTCRIYIIDKNTDNYTTEPDWFILNSEKMWVLL